MNGLARIGPTPAEEAFLRFSFGSGDWPRRLLQASALFAVGVALWVLLPAVLAPLGLVLVVAGHVPLWIRTQTTAPGGATPQHEEVWAPVEEDWLERLREHEARGRRWDASPFDLTSGRGFLNLVLVLAATGAVSLAALLWLGFDPGFRLAVGATVLLVPLWLNGMRTTWNPSELRKKGEALATALAAARGAGMDDFDAVPMLALREGRRGKYPVDAKVMLRPDRDDAEGFLGVQLQVAMNNVQGTDYPYLYAVVLGKEGTDLPPLSELRARPRKGRRIVFEEGRGEDVRYLVVRQHADRKGGWHTDDEDVARITGAALEIGREVRLTNRTEAPG